MPLRHPFGFTPTGRAATLPAGSDEAAAQEIAFLLMTRPGERPLLGDYGSPDPTYDVDGTATVAATVAAFGPTVEVTDLTVTPVNDGLADLEITFNR